MRSFLKILRVGLLAGGGAMLLIGLLSGGAALLSSVDRLRFGGAPLAGDVGIFGLLALVCCVLGAFSLIVARRIARQMEQERR